MDDEFADELENVMKRAAEMPIAVSDNQTNMEDLLLSAITKLDLAEVIGLVCEFKVFIFYITQTYNILIISYWF